MQPPRFAVFIFLFFFSTIEAQQQNWHFTGYGPHFRDFNGVQILHDGRIVAAGGNLFNDAITTLVYSDDSAASWGLPVDTVNAMLNDLYFPADSAGYSVGNAGMVYKSTDEGSNWHRIPLSSPLSLRNYYGVHFTSVSKGIAVGGAADTMQTIMRTTDGGLNWTTVVDAPGQTLRDVMFVDSLIGYTVGDSGTALKTHDGGISWTPLNIPVAMNARNFQSVCFIDSMIGFIAGGNPTSAHRTLLKTTDGGVTWNVISDVVGSMANTVYFLNDTAGYIGGENGLLLYSADQGVTWNPFTISGNDVNSINDINFLNPSFGIASGVYGKTLIYRDTLLHSPTASINGLATIVNVNTAQINGTVNAYTLATHVDFEYGLTTSFGNTIAMTPSLTSTNNQSVSVLVNGLVPATIYYGRIKVSNSFGNFYSDSIRFYTDSIAGLDSLVLPPTAFLNTLATIINANTVQVAGAVNAYHILTTIEFEYGLTPAFGTTIAMTPSSTSNDNQQVSSLVTGLSLSSVYYGRIKVANQLGVAYSGTIMFNTDSATGPNFNFEYWNDYSTQYLGNWSNAGTVQRVLSYDGSYAARLQAANQNSVSAFFYAYDHGNGPPTVGLPFTGGRPDSLTFHAKYSVVANDSALVWFFFKSNGVTIADTMIKITGSSGAAFQYFKIPIHYTSSNIPDSLGLFFTSSDIFANVSTISEMTVDNVHFTNSTSQLPNSDMEFWPVSTRNKAVSWYSNDDMNYNLNDSARVRRSTNAFSGNYAMLLQTFAVSQSYGASLKSGPNVYNYGPDFPVFVRHTSLNGMYEFNTAAQDTFTIMVNMFKLGVPMGGGALNLTTQVSSYSLFSVPINYYTSDVPDSASIQFFIGKRDTLFHAGDSWALIDDLGFDAILTSTDAPNSLGGMNLFPNPAQDHVNIHLPDDFAKQTGEIKITVFDMSGKACILQYETYKSEIQLDVSGLSDQFYFIEIKNEDRTLYSKLIIQR